MWKIANLGYGNGRNSKTIYPIYMIFGRHMQKTNIYKTMKSFFWFFFQIFKLRHKIPWLAASWLPWQPRQNPAPWFCANCSYVQSSQFWKYCENRFLSYVCYRVWPIRGLAWLPWQPDWNDNHFQKVRVMGFVVVYHPCGLAFRKVLKFDVENWAVDHWTPLKCNCREILQLTYHTVYGMILKVNKLISSPHIKIHLLSSFKEYYFIAVSHFTQLKTGKEIKLRITLVWNTISHIFHDFCLLQRVYVHCIHFCNAKL